MKKFSVIGTLALFALSQGCGASLTAPSSSTETGFHTLAPDWYPPGQNPPGQKGNKIPPGQFPTKDN